MSAQGIIRRYYLIMQKISQGYYPSSQELVDYVKDYGFKASTRTLERDRAAIKLEFDVEITYNKGRDGYYIDESKTTDVDSFIRFLEIVNTAELLTESLKESKDALDYISFDQGGGLKGIEHIKDLLNATKNHQKISFEHINYQTGKKRKYTLSPYLLKEYQNRWYIVGKPSGMDQLLTFGIDRIQELTVKAETFKPNPKFNPKEKFREVIGVVYSLNEKQPVVLSFTPAQGNYVKSLPWHESQTVLIDDEKEFRIQLNIVPNYELVQKILMNNEYVRVIEPPSLVNEVAERLKNSLDQY